VTLHAYTSKANNNGSAFAGFAYTHFAALIGTVVMLFGRYVPIVVVLALAASLAARGASRASAGTLRTDTPTFGVVLLGVVVIMSGLTILPSSVLGAAAEAFGG